MTHPVLKHFEEWYVREGHKSPDVRKSDLARAYGAGWHTSRIELRKENPPTPPCGYTEPESYYRDPDTGELKSRTAKCEGDLGELIGHTAMGFKDGTN